MPKRPKLSCRGFGCDQLVEPGEHYCKDCKAKYYARQFEGRDGDTRRLYTYKWQQYSKRFLKNNPLCVECLKDGVLTPSEVTDHIVDHKGDYELFWDKDNHQALCKKCHDIKTARENRFGKR